MIPVLVRLFVFVYLTLAPLVWAFNATNSVGYPICSDNVYLGNGQLDIDSTLYNCSANINGALIIPSYVPKPSGNYDPVNVSLAVKINNLIEVADITSSVTMGFFLRLQWYDQRWYMPDLFEHLSSQATHEGLDITGYVRSQNPLNIWLPDIVFYEGTSMDTLAEFIRLFPDGKVYWSRNLLVTLQESQNLIYSYPNDGQNFSLTFQSYSYETQFLNLKFMDPPVVFRFNAEYGQNAVELNQLWTYQDYSAFVANVDSPAVFNPNRKYSSAYVNLKFTRQSFGVVFRLALPVCMFMLIVGFSFWTSVEKRLELTVEMLLTITALYLIIGTVIPFVGYLTIMDQFMSCVFVLLSLVIGVHVINLKLEGSAEEHPMAQFYADLSVLFFRIVWLPCTIAVFQFFFSVSATIVQLAFYSTCIACASQIVFCYPAMEESFRTSLINLRKKEEEVKEQFIKRDSGKMTGHDAHLIKPLEYTERITLYITRCLYKNKTRHEMRMEALQELQEAKKEEEEDEQVDQHGFGEELKEDTTTASGMELNTVDYSPTKPAVYHAPVSRVSSGGSQGIGGDVDRSFGNSYLAASLAGSSQRDSFRVTSNRNTGAAAGGGGTNPYVESFYNLDNGYNGNTAGFSGRSQSPARYPSSYRSGAGSSRFSERQTNGSSAYGDTYYDYGGRGSGGRGGGGY